MNKKNFLRLTRGVIGSAFLLGAGAANAALSTEAQAAADAVSAAATDWIGVAWSIAIVVTVGFAGIKLFKKAIGKAA